MCFTNKLALPWWIWNSLHIKAMCFLSLGSLKREADDGGAWEDKEGYCTADWRCCCPHQKRGEGISERSLKQNCSGIISDDISMMYSLYPHSEKLFFSAVPQQINGDRFSICSKTCLFQTVEFVNPDKISCEWRVSSQDDMVERVGKERHRMTHALSWLFSNLKVGLWRDFHPFEGVCVWKECFMCLFQCEVSGIAI